MGVRMLDWFKEHETFMLWLSGASAVVFVASMILVPVILVKLPADFFLKEKREKKAQRKKSSTALKIARNIAGGILILLGLAMLVLPGQGLLVILLGIVLTDFPGKYRIERWIISRKKILSTANWLRQKFNKPPLKVEKLEEPAAA